MLYFSSMVTTKIKQIPCVELYPQVLSPKVFLNFLPK